MGKKIMKHISRYFLLSFCLTTSLCWLILSQTKAAAQSSLGGKNSQERFERANEAVQQQIQERIQEKIQQEEEQNGEVKPSLTSESETKTPEVTETNPEKMETREETLTPEISSEEMKTEEMETPKVPGM